MCGCAAAGNFASKVAILGTSTADPSPASEGPVGLMGPGRVPWIMAQHPVDHRATSGYLSPGRARKNRRFQRRFRHPLPLKRLVCRNKIAGPDKEVSANEADHLLLTAWGPSASCE